MNKKRPNHKVNDHNVIFYKIEDCCIDRYTQSYNKN